MHVRGTIWATVRSLSDGSWYEKRNPGRAESENGTLHSLERHGERFRSACRILCKAVKLLFCSVLFLNSDLSICQQTLLFVVPRFSVVRGGWSLELDPGRTFFATSIEISLSLVSQHMAGHSTRRSDRMWYCTVGMHIHMCNTRHVDMCDELALDYAKRKIKSMRAASRR